MLHPSCASDLQPWPDRWEHQTEGWSGAKQKIISSPDAGVSKYTYPRVRCPVFALTSCIFPLNDGKNGRGAGSGQQVAVLSFGLGRQCPLFHHSLWANANFDGQIDQSRTFLFDTPTANHQLETQNIKWA
jgi:hypothetical protein